jgi:hypothetical protein
MYFMVVELDRVKLLLNKFNNEGPKRKGKPAHRVLWWLKISHLMVGRKNKLKSYPKFLTSWKEQLHSWMQLSLGKPPNKNKPAFHSKTSN